MNIIEKIFDAISSLRFFTIVEQDEKAVRLRHGRFRERLSPGFYWQYPIVDHIRRVTVSEQTINLPNQSIATKKGRLLGVSAVLRYCVADPKKALLHVHDYDPSLQNIAMVAIFSYATRDQKPEELEEKILEELQEDVEDWGIEILHFGLTDYVDHKVYRIMTHENPIVIEDEE